MRIVGGELRGRALKAPQSNAIRPTTDRARESLFNVLAHQYADNLKGARVLDLFAGTGALGLEAISRGASYALFVEESVEGRGLLRDNIETLGQTGRTRIFRRDATRLGPAAASGQFSLIFADPPYNKGLGEKALISAAEGNWLVPDALCIVEESVGASFIVPPQFEREAERQYGETILRLLYFRP